MRVICPSAKMQTTSPLLDGLAGFAQGMDHVARTKLRGNGDRAHHFGERLDVRMVVDVLEHEEADVAIGGSEKQEGVDERHVIGDEERAAGFGDVVAAFDAYAVKGVGDHPEHEAEEGIGQEINGIAGGEESEDGAVEKNPSGRLMQDGGEKNSRRRRQGTLRRKKTSLQPRSRHLFLRDAGGAGSER